MILCLDLATTTGWCLGTREKGVLASGTISFKGGRFEGGGMRFLRFRRWLTEVFDKESPTEVYYEEVRRHMSTDAAHIHGGLLAVMQSECEARSIPYSGIPVGTIKKHMTGNGAASKEMMIEAARKLGHNPADDNEADAIGIFMCSSAK